MAVRDAAPKCRRGIVPATRPQSEMKTGDQALEMLLIRGSEKRNCLILAPRTAVIFLGLLLKLLGPARSQNGFHDFRDHRPLGIGVKAACEELRSDFPSVGHVATQQDSLGILEEERLAAIDDVHPVIPVEANGLSLLCTQTVIQLRHGSVRTIAGACNVLGTQARNPMRQHSRRCSRSCGHELAS